MNSVMFFFVCKWSSVEAPTNTNAILERPDEDPVAGAVDVFAEHKVCNKQQNGADGDVEPQLHDALEVAHEPNKEAEKHNADAERGNLHFNGVEPLTAEEQDADAAEEQPNGFNLKADAL